MIVPQKYTHYRPPRLVRGKRWYVEYWYRVPEELRPYNKGKEWRRYRVFEDIRYHQRHGNEEEYARLLLAQVERALEAGYNPMEKELRELAHRGEGDPEGVVDIKEGLELFLVETTSKGLDHDTVVRYENVVTRFQGWLAAQRLHHQPLGWFKQAHLKRFLHELKKENKWSNRQYNNYKGYISTVFAFFVAQHLIPKNPAEGIPALRTETKTHRYYDKGLFPKVNKIIQEQDPYLWIMAQFVYYLAVRSSKELRQLRISDIMDEGENFLFRAEVSKSGRDEIVPIDPHLRRVIERMHLEEWPKEYYIFGVGERPGDHPVSDDYIQKRFRKIRKAAGLSEEYTLYGFKHTRCIHLLKDGVKLADISRLFRHTDIVATAKYARDLGVDFDMAEIKKVSRRI